jgi:cation diffusion facilitator family transporter
LILRNLIVVKKEHGEEDDDNNPHYNNSFSICSVLLTAILPTLKSILLKREKSELEEKVRVAVISIIASASLTIFKFVIGFWTNSLGIMSESMHSGLDFVAAIMTLYAIRVVVRPPDMKYTYGYAKFESISSLVSIILLFAIASWVFYEGIERLLSIENVKPEITIFSFLIMFVSIVVDFARSRALYKAARKYGSQALESDGLHFKTDMISSSIVIVGLSLVLFLDVPNADAYAAIAVAGMIIYTSLGLGRRTIDVLLDRAPLGVYHQVLETISGLEGVNRPHDIRIRKMGPETLVDMHIEVPRTFTHDRAHRVATTVEEKVKQIVPNSDVLVHVDAMEYSNETTVDRIRLIAAETDGIKNVHSIHMSKIVPPPVETAADRELNASDKKEILTSSTPNNFSSTKVRNEESDDPQLLRELSSYLHLYLDVQVNPDMDLKSAHTIIESFEIRLKNEIPQIRNVTTHIEIEASDDFSIIGIEKKSSRTYTEQIRKVALCVDRVTNCKDVSVVDVNGEQHITLTISIEANLGKDSTSLVEAHRIATHVQNLIIKQTGASRVVVHTEPAK